MNSLFAVNAENQIRSSQKMVLCTSSDAKPAALGTASHQEYEAALLHLAHHVRDGKLVLVLLDESLVHKKIEDHQRVFDFTAAFYQGNNVEETAAIPFLERASIIHAAGKKTLAFLRKQGFNINEGITVVKGVPLIQIICA
jgi:hypothetical protein